MVVVSASSVAISKLVRAGVESSIRSIPSRETKFSQLVLMNPHSLFLINCLAKIQFEIHDIMFT